MTIPYFDLSSSSNRIHFVIKLRPLVTMLQNVNESSSYFRPIKSMCVPFEKKS